MNGAACGGLSARGVSITEGLTAGDGLLTGSERGRPSTGVLRPDISSASWAVSFARLITTGSAESGLEAAPGFFGLMGVVSTKSKVVLNGLSCGVDGPLELCVYGNLTSRIVVVTPGVAVDPVLRRALGGAGRPGRSMCPGIGSGSK